MKMEKNLDKCEVCPRQCKVNRNEGKTGYCGEGYKLVVARAALHYWEEPCISGEDGSGTIFFSGCPLRCVFCQNNDIALARRGKEISVDRLVEIFFELKEKGANNINLVTPTHYIYQIREALIEAKNRGFDLPVVYNTGGYEKVESLKLLEGLVDVYLPDLKYKSSELSLRYSNASDYFEVATKAIQEMVRQVGAPEFFDNGIIKSGVIVRHLVLPGATKDSKEIIKYLYETYGNDIFISIMNQFTPQDNIDKIKYKELTRKITQREYDNVIDYAIEQGVENGFIQEGDTAKESFIPSFDLEGV